VLLPSCQHRAGTQRSAPAATYPIVTSYSHDARVVADHLPWVSVTGHQTSITRPGRMTSLESCDWTQLDQGSRRSSWCRSR